MKQFHFLTLILISLNFAYCSKPGKPEFRKLENLEISSIKNGNLILNADAVFYNPNPAKVKVQKIDLNIFVNDQEVGSLAQVLDVIIPAKSEFRIPVKLNASTKKLSGGWLGSAISILGNGSFDLNIKGTATINVLKIPIEIPINHFEKLELNF